MFFTAIYGVKGNNMIIKQGLWTIDAKPRSLIQIQLDGEQQFETVIGAL
ncbi:hypothetical protein GCM10009193_04740 [Shewanella aestuarii]|nr:hypothetical protein GCM10009193_04740 [Shewanella aestuarii]